MPRAPPVTSATLSVRGPDMLLPGWRDAALARGSCARGASKGKPGIIPSAAVRPRIDPWTAWLAPRESARDPRCPTCADQALQLERPVLLDAVPVVRGVVDVVGVVAGHRRFVRLLG